MSSSEAFTSGNWDVNSTWEMSTNNGSTWFAATSTPRDTSGSITIKLSHNVTVTSSVSADQVTVESAGTITINTSIVFTIVNGIGNDFTLLKDGTVTVAGTFQTQGAVFVNVRTGSNFNAAFKVNTGTATVSELSSPHNGRLFGNVTVDAGATLFTNNSSSYTLFIYGNLTNNGTITGTGATNTIKFFGATLANGGSITSPTFSFDSTTTVSGTGTWTGGAIFISANGNVSLSNNLTFSITGIFSISSSGDFSANTRVATFTSGTLELLSGGIIANSGTIRTQGTVSINTRTGSFFNAPLNVNTGTTIVSELSSPHNGRLFGNVTVDAGATLNTNNSSSYTLFIFGNIINNGIFAGIGDVEFQTGVHTLQGTGIFSVPASVLSGGTLNLSSNHKMLSVNINTGGLFNISNYVLSLSASNPITQNGAFSNTNSTIEYNGVSTQIISTTNFNYHRLKINNSAGTSLFGNTTVNDTLTVLLGDLNLNGKILTMSATAYLTETAGNTVTGTTGYMTNTRNINAPLSLNVAGLGAVLTTGSNLGSTEVRRGHTIQTGLNGGSSIARYFDITPANNSGLDATLVFKYDDSELNGKPEASLKLFSSTNTGTSWALAGGAPNAVNNTISIVKLNSFSRWSADSNSVSMVLKVIVEGFYGVMTNRLSIKDTVRAYLRNISSPYTIKDSGKSVIDSITFNGAYNFPNATTGTYYIQTKHRNALETWSRSGGEPYTVGNTLNYDFTSSAGKAFGSNLTQKGTKFCLYSGDIDQEGNVDVGDVVAIYNDALNFDEGYIVTDLNGDDITDVSDLTIAYNNSVNFVTVARP